MKNIRETMEYLACCAFAAFTLMCIYGLATVISCLEAARIFNAAYRRSPPATRRNHVSTEMVEEKARPAS